MVSSLGTLDLKVCQVLQPPSLNVEFPGIFGETRTVIQITNDADC